MQDIRKLLRPAAPIVAVIATLGTSQASFAGDLRDSISRAAEEQARQESAPRKIDKAYLVPGVALFVGGMSMALYGFLHTSGGEFVSGMVSKESKTGLGAAGLGVAAAGGAVLFFGTKHPSKAPSISAGPRGVTVSKRLEW